MEAHRDTDGGPIIPEDGGGLISASWRRRLEPFVAPAIAATFSVGLNLYRINQGLARTLGESLSPAELIAYDRNPLLSVVGFPSGSELTAVSLPLKGYHLFEALGVGALDATRTMIAVETLWMFAGVFWAVRVARPTVSRNVAAIAATVACVGYVLAGNNLANWGFLWGWNYGFAYSLVCLLLAFAVRGRWNAFAVAAAVLVTIHSVVAVLAVLVVLPLLAADVVRRQVHPRWSLVAGSALAAGGYLFTARGDVRLAGGALDTARYVARLRAFQYHLFYEFDLEFLRPLAHDLGAWAVGALLMLVVVASLRAGGELNLANRVLVVMAVIAVLSLVGWTYSTIGQPNPTILLLAFHRSSVFMNLLVLFVGLPIVLGQLRNGLRLATTTTIVVWTLMPASDARVAVGLLCVVLLLSWFGAIARRGGFRAVRFLVLPVLLAAVSAGFFLVEAGRRAGSMTMFVSNVLAESGFAWFCVLIAMLAVAPWLVARSDVDWHSINRVPTSAVVALSTGLAVALVLGSTVIDNPTEIDGASGAVRDDLLEVQRWARSNTATDANFLLPLDSFGFGWRVFSERASAGKPREWLHYAFLYSRDQGLLEEGTRRANLLGVDVDDWLAAHPELRSGPQLVKELDARYEALTDAELVDFVNELDADYIVFDANERRESPCLAAVFSNPSFWVAELTGDCRAPT